jgi:hypothetical protein
MKQRKQPPRAHEQPRTILVSTYPEALPSAGRKAKRQSRPQRGAAHAQPWTKEHDQFLRKHYPDFGSIICARHLGRTKSAVNTRAEKLGIRSKRVRAWTAKEEAILRTQYGKVTGSRLAAMLKRSDQSVRHQLRKMGLTEATSTAWSDDEIAYLRVHHTTATNAELAEELGRTEAAVELKASRLGLGCLPTPVTPEMERAIVKRLGSNTFAEIARELGLTVDRVRRIGTKHGYHARPTSRKWTDDDDDALRRLFPTMTNAELATHLERTELAVSLRGRTLGLVRPTGVRKRPGTYKSWTAAEERLLKRLYPTTMQRQIAERLGRTPGAINRKACLLGLVKRPERLD